MIQIPLTLLNLQDDGFHLLMEVIVFNQPFKAVLDTGASKTVFDKTSIERHINPELLKLSDQLSTGLGTKSMESYVLNIPDLQIGDLHLKDYNAAVLDLSTINFAYEQIEQEPIIGVIGGDLLFKYQAIIDYKKSSLIFNREITDL
ncbi:retropepsin-like aspartic protease [Albibacterium sp.]|uniref:retropepsin-like aspartic protease n=1 Tax=Albibacterium sp. TaxID=2952885 RepID=UPI002C878380|nr:retropepsin-like aspartic protease [Albibacterium sp.]HUH19474.1 retropepsin-like aspartic protease [Albibacterium sp.]